MMKRILLIATGGTIASAQSPDGLTPMITSEELLRYIPEVQALCDIDTVQLMNLDSTNITPEHWLSIVKCLRENYESYDGFVITHGTDTMAYTAAALSYLVQDSLKPIVLTGGQKSITLADTDARRNLYDSFLFVSNDYSHGIHVVFNGEVILGTRARKERTKSYNAFTSVDYPSAAVIRDRKLIPYLSDDTSFSDTIWYDKLDTKVLLLTLIPGMRTEALAALKDSYDGLILQTFGSGGLPTSHEGEFSAMLGEWIAAGKTVVIMTQVPFEGSDLSIYQVGQQILKHYPVLEASNMTREAVVTKLMWALGQTKDPAKVKELFYHPINHDRLD